ncbi:hypothetical protein I7I48_02783 [Histoplasma ohiense]|nr:hypothetical protein I7I48_02783 [Histoplasma ohiense (nom. inval.)]
MYEFSYLWIAAPPLSASHNKNHKHRDRRNRFPDKDNPVRLFTNVSRWNNKIQSRIGNSKIIMPRMILEKM